MLDMGELNDHATGRYRCIIKSHIPSDKDGVESGEQLALKSFYKGHSKLFDSVFMSG